MKLLIEGMTCPHCENAVFNALSDVEGVSDVKVDLKGNFATLTASEDLKVTLIKAIEEEGYKVLEVTN